MGAADTAAVHPLGFPGPDALDEGDTVRLLEIFHAVSQPRFQLQMSHHSAVSAVKVFGRFVLPGTHSDHRGSVFYPSHCAIHLDVALEPAHRTGCIPHFRSLQYFDIFMIFHSGDNSLQLRPHLPAFPCFIQVPCVPSKPFRFFDDQSLETLVGQGQSGVHARQSSSDHKRFLHHFDLEAFDGHVQGSLGKSHSNLVFGLFRGFYGVALMHPGVLVADVRHFEQVCVQTRLSHGVLEQRFVGSWSARGDNDAICFEFLDLLRDEILGIRGTGKEIVFHKYNMGQGSGIFSQFLHIHHPGYVHAAGAHEDADPGVLRPNVPLRTILLLLRQCSFCRRKGSGRFSSCCGRLGHRPRDRLGGHESPRRINALSAGSGRIERHGSGKTIGIEFYARNLRKFLGVC